ncbi:MAG: LuxR C-terminal-related transcriptional regulator [Cyclobacteriaceae bacterium]
MELQRLLIWICFAICLGLTAWGVLIFFRVKERASLPAVRLFQYYLVMIFAFAYYGIWSDVFIKLFLLNGSYANEPLTGISNILFIVSTPFLMIGLSMLVIWAFRMIRKKSVLVLVGGLAIALSIIIIVVWQIAPITLEDQVLELLSLLSLAVTVFVAFQLYFSKLKYLSTGSAMIMASLMLGFACLQYLLVLSAADHIFLRVGYLFLFFLLNSAMGVFLVYAGDFPVKETGEDSATFASFAEKYGITAREQEVIQEIYKGKTNREIADTLFVTVQTIKDHTHRIYQKTNVRNRNQLTSLLRRLEIRIREKNKI